MAIPISFMIAIGSLHGSCKRQAAAQSIRSCWVSPHTARRCRRSWSFARPSRCGFTDQAGFSFVCRHTTRFDLSRTPVRNPILWSISGCSQCLEYSPRATPADRLCDPVASCLQFSGKAYADPFPRLTCRRVRSAI